MMERDDEVCLCFHVTRRKIENYILRTRPQRASQLSDCFGAGTGCGWCRPFLKRLWQRAQPDHHVSEDCLRDSAEHFDQTAAAIPGTIPTTHDPTDSPSEAALELFSAAEYARQRAEYRKKKDV
jgi:bacterioferritin-associated ferredoxin